MHRCLQIVEVVRAIAVEVDSDEPVHLVSLAITCRAFFDPAIDVLWEYLRNPEPLFRCLPAHTRGQGSEELTITSPPSEAEWKRFELYAGRVKRLHIYFYSEIDQEDVPLPSWESLKVHYPGPVLLPNLRRFATDLEEISEWYSFIFSSSLKALQLEFWTEESAEAFCDAAHLCSQSLEDLDLNESWDPEDVPADTFQQVSRAISGMSSLKTLESRRLLPETLVHLTTLPAFETLSIEVYSVQHRREAGGPLAFPHLKNLSLSATPEDIAAVVSILKAYRFPVLTSLTVTISRVHDDHTQPEELFQPSQLDTLVAAMSKLDTLRSLKINLLTSHLTLIPAHCYADLSPISGLFTLRHLEHLDMGSVPFNLKPTDIPQIATAWPKLQSLLLSTYRPKFSNDDSLTVEHLLPFVAHCPDLETLGLPLNFLLPPEQCPPLGQSTSKLRTLECGFHNVRYSSGLAAFLASVVPHAKLSRHEMHTSFSPDDDLAVMEVNTTKRLLLDAFEQGKRSGA